MFDPSQLPDNPYILLTPGPLSTSKGVKATMLRDWCTWDDDYKAITQDVRRRLVALATPADGYASVLMQGSGTFAVESVVGSVLPENGKLLVLANGAYGNRIAAIAGRLRIDHTVMDSGETGRPDPEALKNELERNPEVTHVAVVHCETTTGMLNPVSEIGAVVKAAGRTFIVDAMSSFGGIPMDVDAIGADFLISSANKCIQGVPGFGFVVARRRELEACAGRSRSLSLDLYDQWRVMEEKGGKWRFTSPTHVVRAFATAMDELEAEGGVVARHGRYSTNQRALVKGMRALGFQTLLPDEFQSPIITAFLSPSNPEYRFQEFYHTLKSRGFVIYPGKVTSADTFRIGNIGEVYSEDVERFLTVLENSIDWKMDKTS
jgi:2-aminoethylphosphonate-pyruvate transaminase